ncbi:hypothetical protein H2200_000249 [Cladophialophora chaetospira]|uniref:Molybdopterin synthase sulfur carrier subunit n=1 Tax=Cladophialophora chaetospira TaxID=386627 RepID=A0AA38XN28_9EURO|nr:hypothetical protein H2200_000249 [Cladophialophora chaetospira]
MTTLIPQENSNLRGTFTLLLFASASTFAGNIETLTLPAPTTLRSLFSHLESQFPGFKAKVLRSSAVTVNLEYVDFEPDELEGDNSAKGGRGDEGTREGEGEGLDLRIQPGDEVGIIPPVSSG